MTITMPDELIRVVEAASENLRRMKDAEVASKPAAGKWSKKEMLGHLIDSAANNHQRFVRAQAVEEFIFPPYEPNEWGRFQCYNTGNWVEMIELWRLYNRHLAHIIRQIPEDKLKVICRIGAKDPITLGYLIEDYLAHTKHHLQQLGAV